MRPAHHIVTCKWTTVQPTLNHINSITDELNPGWKLTCWLKLIFSYGVFFVRFDRNDRGKTKAALPTIISPNSIELTETDVPGLHFKTLFHRSVVMTLLSVRKIVPFYANFKSYLLLTNRHFSISRASMPTYRNMNISATKDSVAKACLKSMKTNSHSNNLSSEWEKKEQCFSKTRIYVKTDILCCDPRTLGHIVPCVVWHDNSAEKYSKNSA